MARSESSNPALTRAFSGPSQAVGFDRRVPSDPYTVDPIEQAYNGPTATSRDTGRMTIEDVVVKTAVLLGIVVVTGAATWALGLTALLLPALVIGLVLGLVIAFKQITNPVPILVYAAVEGVVLGAFSRLITYGNVDLVLQASVGTIGVAAGTLFLYRSGRIRVTPRFTKMLLAGLMGFLALAVVNIGAGFFTEGGLGLRDGSPLAIGFSLLAIGLGALTLVLDFDFVDKATKHGAPERYSWLAAFGILVSLVWLYIEILRLLSYFTNNE